MVYRGFDVREMVMRTVQGGSVWILLVNGYKSYVDRNYPRAIYGNCVISLHTLNLDAYFALDKERILNKGKFLWSWFFIPQIELIYLLLIQTDHSVYINHVWIKSITSIIEE